MATHYSYITVSDSTICWNTYWLYQDWHVCSGTLVCGHPIST